MKLSQSFIYSLAYGSLGIVVAHTQIPTIAEVKCCSGVNFSGSCIIEDVPTNTCSNIPISTAAFTIQSFNGSLIWPSVCTLYATANCTSSTGGLSLPIEGDGNLTASGWRATRSFTCSALAVDPPG